MAYLITYSQNNEQHILEWIAGNGWSVSAIRECFAVRFPQAEIIAVEERPCCSL
jgi:hypothetical protein